MWDISLDHVKCLPLHFSFCVILISTKKNYKFIQNKIIQYLDLINFIQKLQLIFKKEYIKYIRNYNQVNKQSKYIIKIIQTQERHNKNKYIQLILNY
jgi:Tfp pilus assembly protein PilZ